MNRVIVQPPFRSLYFIMGHAFVDNEPLEDAVEELIRSSFKGRNKILTARRSIEDMVTRETRQ